MATSDGRVGFTSANQKTQHPESSMPKTHFASHLMADRPIHSLAQKYFVFVLSEFMVLSCRSISHEGRFAVVTDVEAGLSTRRGDLACTGALFAFATAPAAIMLTLFVADPNQATPANAMFAAIRDNIISAIAATATGVRSGTIGPPTGAAAIRHRLSRSQLDR